MNKSLKPGWKTTEFWVALISQILGLLVVLGVITPEQQNTLNQAATQVAGGVVMAASAFGYCISRGQAKSNKKE